MPSVSLFVQTIYTVQVYGINYVLFCSAIVGSQLLGQTYHDNTAS